MTGSGRQWSLPSTNPGHNARKSSLCPESVNSASECINTWKRRTNLTGMGWDLRNIIQVIFLCIAGDYCVLTFVFGLNIWNVYKYKHMFANTSKNPYNPGNSNTHEFCRSDYSWNMEEACLKPLWVTQCVMSLKACDVHHFVFTLVGVAF